MNVLILISTFFAMEAFTWLTHKYVMHGFLWFLHEDHHQPKESFWEKNDFFFIIFSLPSMALIISGSIADFDWRFFVGIGVTIHGLAYFLVHDILIHQRFSWFKKIDSVYFRALRKGHKVHHKNQNKEDGECFGMLWVPVKYFKEAAEYKRRKTQTS